MGSKRIRLGEALGISISKVAPLQQRNLANAIEKDLETFEKRLLDRLTLEKSLGDVPSRYLAEAGGKRVRPILVFLTARLGGGVNDDVFTAAEAVEITHLATLYHDDVMDEAPQRRGVPSVHSVWGNSVAILTGDLLLAKASRLIIGLNPEGLDEQARTFERLVNGQLLETLGPADGDDPIEHYLRVLADKTASLIALSAKFGAMYSGAPVEFQKPLTEYGEALGVAFQLIDDVIDLSNSPETGKVAGTDLRAGVETMPSLLLASRSDEESKALRVSIEKVLKQETTEQEADATIAALAAHPVTAETVAEARKYAGIAKDALAILNDDAVKSVLVSFADAIVNRNK